MTGIVRGADFREVDAAADPHALVATLDAVARARYDSMLWMRDLKEGVAYLPD